MYPRILVAVDGSYNSERTAARAGQLAALSGASLIMVTVESESGRSAAATDVLERAQERARVDGGLTPNRIALETRRGDPAEALLAAASEHAVGAIVVGSRGHGRLVRLVLGSVSQKLAGAADVDVLVVR